MTAGASSAPQGFDLAAESLVVLGEALIRGLRTQGTLALLVGSLTLLGSALAFLGSMLTLVGGDLLGGLACFEPPQQPAAAQGVDQAKLLTVSLKV